MTLGLLWSLAAVGVTVFAAPYVLRPVSGTPGDVGDRFAGSVALTAAGAAVGSGSMSVWGGWVGAPVASDLWFWAAAAAGVAGYAGRGRGRPFRSARARAAEAAPWLLAAYGTFLVACLVRSVCGTLGGRTTPGFGIEPLAGVVALVASWALHRSWWMGDRARIAAAAALIASIRLGLGRVPLRPVSAVVVVVVALGAVAVAVRARMRRNAYVTHEGAADD